VTPIRAAIEEGPERLLDSLVARTSPSRARALPARAQSGGPRPPGGRADGAGRLVVLMAAWNDHGYQGRLRLAGDLAARGIASVMLEQPFYGPPPVPGEEQPSHGGRLHVDGAGRGARRAGARRPLPPPGYRVGVTGYSMGGNMAGFISATMPSRWPPPCSPPPSRRALPSCTASCRRPSTGRRWGATTRRRAIGSARCCTQPASCGSGPGPHPGSSASSGDPRRLRPDGCGAGYPPPLARLGGRVGRWRPRQLALVLPDRLVERWSAPSPGSTEPSDCLSRLCRPGTADASPPALSAAAVAADALTPALSRCRGRCGRLTPPSPLTRERGRTAWPCAAGAPQMSGRPA